MGPVIAALALAAALHGAPDISAVHADVAASAYDPALTEDVWIFGDTTVINGRSVVSGYGYPHSTIGAGNPLRVRAGRYGYGWQAVPNWPDGTYFWAGGIVADRGTVYVFGQRIRGVSPFSIVGDYVARFSASTLAYQGMSVMPGTVSWGGVLPARYGFWITGTRGAPKTGDIAWVPWGHEAASASWRITRGTFPASDGLGTTIALARTGSGVAAYTKRWDAYGSDQIEKLTASWPGGRWTLASRTITAQAPTGCVTYSIEAHAGGWLSYAVNGPAQYWPDFIRQF